jgi:hypothetical protein
LRRDPINLKEILVQDPHKNLTRPKGSKRVIQAYTGHILLTSPTSVHRASLLPPLKGFWPFEKIMKWVQSSDSKAIFVPSLPSSLLDAPSTEPERKILHRLLYRVLREPCEAPTTPHPTKIIKLEIILTKPKPDESRNASADALPENTEAPPPEVIETSSQDPCCWLGSESIADLMIPDRPMDLRFTVCDLLALNPGQEPTELQDYLTNLRAFLEYRNPDAARPDPPLTINHNGETYVLHSTSSVWQSAESLRSSEVMPTSIKAISENTLDLESNQKSVSYQVVCDDQVSDVDWAEFLRNCDRSTSVSYPKSS